MADTKFFIIIITFIALFTIISSLIITSYDDWNTNKTTDIINAGCPSGAYCPQQPDQPEEYTIYGNIDLTKTDVSNVSYIIVSSTDFVIPAIDYWLWNDGIGMISQHIDALAYNYLYVNGVRPVKNFYSMNYLINNTIKKPFTILLHGEYKAEYFILEFRDDGIFIPGWIPWTYDYQYPIPSQFTITEFNISTEYNPSTHNLTVWVNNQYGFRNLIINEPCGIFCPTDDITDYYGGVGARDKYVTVKSIYSLGGIQVNNVQDTTGFLDDIWRLVPYYKEIGQFTGTIWGLVTFDYSFGNHTDLTGTVFVPWYIVIFAIYIPLIAAVGYIITILRGN